MLQVAGYRHALVAWLDAKAIPEATPSITFAVGDPSRPLTEDNAVLFTLGTPGPRAPGHVPVWVECVVPANVVEPGPSYLGALRGRLLHTLGRAFPGAARTRVGAASPYDGLAADVPGSAPGKPIHTGQTCVFGAAPASTGRHRRPAARSPRAWPGMP